MEILIASLSLLTLLVVAILIGTRGRPMRFFTAFVETMRSIWANRGPLVWVTLSVFLVMGFLFFYYGLPAAMVGPAQPIPFSHRLHAGHKGIDCRFCHPYVARSIHPGLPPVEKCLYCHNYIIANHPEIRKEHDYFNTKTPTPWVKVYYVPEHVLFNHQRHIKKEIACEACHGDVKRQDRLKGQRFKMGFCIQCHRERKVNLDCWLACHS
ncbi:MAG: cytochrome c3 family protein [Desulfatitalea sp.]|nr:cytochrome c family protein [Desulfatitalea sp.]NNK02512.1 cytochrome c3 family protein [Desulfatitalea sp.]